MSSMKSTSRLSRSMFPMESANLCWRSSTSYSRDQLGLHLHPDGLDDRLNLLRDVEMESQHLTEDQGPLLQVEHDVVSHLGCVRSFLLSHWSQSNSPCTLR